MNRGGNMAKDIKVEPVEEVKPVTPVEEVKTEVITPVVVNEDKPVEHVVINDLRNP